jgi:site-specific recombinase XerD
MALQEGADIGYVSKTLGHNSIRITTEKYMRYIKDADQRNRNKIDQMIDIPR